MKFTKLFKYLFTFICVIFISFFNFFNTISHKNIDIKHDVISKKYLVDNESTKNNFDDLKNISSDENKNDLDLNAKSGAILIDARTKDVLYAKNAGCVAPMASTTKIMTAILALENIKNLKKSFEVDENAIQVEGSSMGLVKGNVLNMHDLLVGLILSSGNDAANEIAVRVVKELIENKKIKDLKNNESKKKATTAYIVKFVELMNNKAKELGLKNTKFSSPSGLGPEDVIYSKKYNKNETTAKELAFLASCAYQNKTFRDICCCARKSIDLGTKISDNEVKKEKRWYLNHNKLLREKTTGFYKFATGIKTGFTKVAGRCLVASAEQDGVSLIAVVLHDPQDWDDCKKMFNYGFTKYEKIDLKKDLPDEEIVENKFFKVTQKGDVNVKLTKEMKKNRKISTKIKSNNSIFFNVEKGEKVGEAEYYLDDVFLCKTDLLADRNVNYKT